MKLNEFPYSSRRSPVVAHRGAVATSQPLAVRQGLAMLEAGGSAVDAALAAATVLVVTEPQSNGIGGDAFALVWDGAKLHGLNGSGRAPERLSPGVVRAAGHETMPTEGWLCATVPGAPRAWHDLHARFGKLPFEQVLAGAIRIAEQGFAVTPQIAADWHGAAQRILKCQSEIFAAFGETFCLGDRGPRAGELFRNPHMAATLRRLAEHGVGDFYEGELARRIVAFASMTGGDFTLDDLAGHASTWVEPIHTNYRGYDVWEIPPNGQGITALIALNLLEGFDMASLGRDSVDAYHLGAEAMKLAFADAARYVADPEHADVPVQGLLAKAYADERRKLIAPQAAAPLHGSPPRGGTVYLCAADEQGMMVSFIQSLYQGFGSGVTVPGTGICLQNRGANFSLELGHPNELAGGKRPYHTIIPGFLTRDGEAVGPFGVMGGFMQPQGYVQMVLNTVDWGLHPQASLDAPRWQVSHGKRLAIEAPHDAQIAVGLEARGHELTVQPMGGAFGRGQIIWRHEHGGYVAGSDPRSDGLALGY